MLYLLALFVAPICIYTVLQLLSLRKNISAAKASGLPYAFVPFFIANPANILLLAIANRIPPRRRPWRLDLISSLDFTHGWHNGNKSFTMMNTSSFLAVSPGSVTLYTRDPEVSTHFLRAPNIGKPAALLDILNIYGPTMTGTDGAPTRLYRKTTAPFFNDQTMRKVWRKSVQGTSALMELFGGKADVNSGGAIMTEEGGMQSAQRNAKSYTNDMRNIVARLTLHVVSSVCFEKENESKSSQEVVKKILSSADEVPPQQRMTFSESMHGVLESFAKIYFTPKFLFENLPFQSLQEAKLPYQELGHYMKDMKRRGESDISFHEKKAVFQESSNILDLLSRARLDNNLSDSEVLGNIFIFLFAGHEANANTLTFMFLLLACNPDAQRKAQADIDKLLLRINPVSELDNEKFYDEAYSQLMESHVGACINETLRLYTVLPYFVKQVPKGGQGHDFTIGGNSIRIPGSSIILINTTAAHTNPEHWPDDRPTPVQKRSLESSSHRFPTRPSTVDAFQPERWFTTDAEGKSAFLRPQPGTLIPFSESSRGCLGKRFALVELCAVITRVLAEYSIELVAENEEEWWKAREVASQTLADDIEIDMSLRLIGKVDVRFVRRGHEKVVW